MLPTWNVWPPPAEPSISNRSQVRAGDEAGPATSDPVSLIEGSSRGDEQAAARLFVAVYDRLRALAARYLRAERGGHTLQPTALVHEAYLRLVGGRAVKFDGRTHFFAIAARAMRQVLVDHARGRAAAKRGRDPERVTLADTLGLVANQEARQLDVLALDDVLRRLERLDPRQARVVELRYFGGLTIAEAAGALGVSTRTVEDDWAMARPWLARELSGSRRRRRGS